MLKRFFLFLSLFLLIIAGGVQATKIEIKNRQLFVNDKAFIVKGVCYSGVPVGKPELYAWEDDAQDLNMDFPLIKAMGANCIRTYTSFNHSTALDAAYQNGLYVIIEMTVPWGTNYSAPNIKTNVLNSAKRMIDKWKSHPGVLMWCIGHEIPNNVTPNQCNLTTSNRMRTWYPLLNEVAGKIHEWEAPYWHPVTYGEGVADVTHFGYWKIPGPTIGNPTFHSEDTNMKNLDIWGAQYYPGDGFEPTFFSKYKSLSEKPLWIGETGCDAFDMSTTPHQENQTMQAQYLMDQWKAVKNNLSAVDANNPCVGVTFFSWDDGWYKSAGANSVHDTNASWANTSYGDYAGTNNMNEEWWGIVSIAPNTYNRGLRTAYYSLQKEWATGYESPLLQNFLFKKQSINLPNPFNITSTETTEIWVYLNQPSKVTAWIYDYSGKLIKKIEDSTGFPGNVYSLKWDGKDANNKKVNTGLYLCKIKAEFEISSTSQQETQLIKIAVTK